MVWRQRRHQGLGRTDLSDPTLARSGPSDSDGSDRMDGCPGACEEGPPAHSVSDWQSSTCAESFYFKEPLESLGMDTWLTAIPDSDDEGSERTRRCENDRAMPSRMHPTIVTPGRTAQSDRVGRTGRHTRVGRADGQKGDPTQPLGAIDPVTCMG